MAPVGESLPNRQGEIWSRSYRCDSCLVLSVGLLAISSNSARYVDAAFEDYNAHIIWLPHKNLGRRFDDVPDPIASAASEAYACYSIRSYRASVLLARSVVEAVAKEQGLTEGSLYNKITALQSQGILKPLTAETAHEIRLLGNEMAHGDFVEDISEEDCDDVLNFMAGILSEIYQQPALLTRYRDQRLRRSTIE